MFCETSVRSSKKETNIARTCLFYNEKLSFTISSLGRNLVTLYDSMVLPKVFRSKREVETCFLISSKTVAVVLAYIHEVHHSIRNALWFLFCSYIFHDHISLIIVHKDSDYFDMMKREAEKSDEIGHFFLLALFCKVKTTWLLDQQTGQGCTQHFWTIYYLLFDTTVSSGWNKCFKAMKQLFHCYLFFRLLFL